MGSFAKPLVAVSLIAVGTVGIAQASEVLIGTGEFPPYTTESSADHGCAIKIIRNAYEAQGWTITLQFLSWPRNLVSLERGEIDASAYWAKRSDRIENYIFPKYPVTSAVSLFIFPKDAAIEWTTIEDLRGKTIIINTDYTYTEEFYASLDKFELRVEEVVEIEKNLRMLLRGRADLTVMDEKVLEKYLSELSEKERSMLYIDDKPAFKVDGFLIFSRENSEKSQELAGVFDKGYEKIRDRGDVREAFKTCGL